jgi:hypothetical protein
VPYTDPERRRAAKRESARRARSRRVDPVDPVDPGRPGTSAGAGTSPSVGPAFVGPGVDPGSTDATRSAALLEVLLAELALVRAFASDPLSRGRVVAQLVGVALTASRSAELEAEVAELERTVARLRTENAHTRGPRRLA